jgi:hypothetical protein
MHAELINSWKEIAAYLRRGIRTVQRWELDLGLPVHRRRGKARSAVNAFKSELDTWMRDAGGTSAGHPQHCSKFRFDHLQQNRADLQIRRAELQALRSQLRTQTHRAYTLVKSVTELTLKRPEATSSNGDQAQLSDRCAAAQQRATAICIKSGRARASAQAALQRSRATHP